MKIRVRCFADSVANLIASGDASCVRRAEAGRGQVDEAGGGTAPHQSIRHFARGWKRAAANLSRVRAASRNRISEPERVKNRCRIANRVGIRREGGDDQGKSGQAKRGKNHLIAPRTEVDFDRQELPAEQECNGGGSASQISGRGGASLAEEDVS